MLDVLDVPEVIRRVLLCMLEAAEGALCSLEVLDVRMRCAVCYSVCWRLWKVGSVCWTCSTYRR